MGENEPKIDVIGEEHNQPNMETIYNALSIPLRPSTRSGFSEAPMAAERVNEPPVAIEQIEEPSITPPLPANGIHHRAQTSHQIPTSPDQKEPEPNTSQDTLRTEQQLQMDNEFKNFQKTLKEIMPDQAPEISIKLGDIYKNAIANPNQEQDVQPLIDWIDIQYSHIDHQTRNRCKDLIYCTIESITKITSKL